MAKPQISARSRAAGVVHVRTRHTDRFTIVGHHLAQHRGLTLTAIGLAVYIQSLPDGARVDIKSLAGRFPEGETRIAAALRELVAHGYLSRTRERLPSGRVVTRTVAYDRPGAVAPTRLAPAAAPAPAAAVPPPVPMEPPVQPVQEAQPPVPEAAGRRAAALLSGLRRYDERLLLAVRDVERLVPAVAEWLARGVSPEGVRRVLTSGLPDVPRHPAALLAHRLTALLPPPLPAEPPGEGEMERPPPVPLQNCDGCDRAFRAPDPGRCRDCRADGASRTRAARAAA